MGPKPKPKAAPVVEDFLTNVKFTDGVEEANIRTRSIKDALKVTRQNLINIRKMMTTQLVQEISEKEKHQKEILERGKEKDDQTQQISEDKGKQTQMGEAKDDQTQMGEAKDDQTQQIGEAKFEDGQKDDNGTTDEKSGKVLKKDQLLRQVQADLQGKLKELEETTKGLRDTFGVTDEENVYESVEPSRLDVEMCSIHPVINMKDFSPA